MFREPLPSSVLRSIVDRVEASLAISEAKEPVKELERKASDVQEARDFVASLSSGFGLIAEIKKKSPSRGDMYNNDVDEIAHIYARSEAVKAVSVLTNSYDFGMEISDLKRVRDVVSQPILRKDFIFSTYQVWQAKAYGADAILLMANVVTKEGLKVLSELAESLGMGVLFESHHPDELKKFPENPKVCGINSRRFMAGKGKSTRLDYWLSRTFGRFVRDKSIDLSSFDAVKNLPKDSIKVAESGVDPHLVSHLRDELHFDSMLVGTSLLMDERGVLKSLSEFERAMKINPISLPVKQQKSMLHHEAAA